MLARNEDWVLGLSARVALSWLDHLIVLNHASTDRTADILCELSDEFDTRISILDDPYPTWNEMAQRQRMLEWARQNKATHVAIVDADELLTGNLVNVVRDAIGPMPRGYIFHLPGYNLRGSLQSYHANGIWGNRTFSTVFVDEPCLHWAGDTFHSREPGGRTLTTYRTFSQGEGGTMHLWGASERRLKAKHALYKLTERLRWPDKRVEEIDTMYSWAIHGEGRNRAYGCPETWGYAEVPSEWWAPWLQWGEYLHVDAVPWQEAEVQRLIQEYGPEPFSRLDLFGLA